MKQDCLPFESFSQNGEYIGINADYLRYYAKKLKLQLKIIPITNLSSDFDLLQKNCDIQSIFNKNIKVELPYVATNVYFGDKISLTTKVDTPYIPTLESVKMKKFVMVGMNKEFYSYMKYKYPDLNITIVPTIYEALKRVDNGTVYGYIGTSFISSYYIQKYFSKDLKISNSFDNLNFSFGISNKELELLPILNKVIASMPKEEDMEIFHKWIVQPLTVDNSQDSINKIILIFTSIFLVLIYFYLKELRLKKKIEEKGAELKVYKDRLEFAFEGSNDGLWDWDLTTNHLFLSIRWKSMLGYEESELSNQYESWESIIHPDDLADFRESIQNHFDKKTILYENIHRIKHKNGDWVWIKTRGKARFNDSGEVIRFLGTNTDITREKDLTDNLAELVSKSLKELRAKDNIVMQQSKLAAMGEMVGNIAHQWRQPLNAIGAMNMRVETMLEYGEVITSDSYAKISLDINHQLKFMSKTIDDFREFYTNKKVKAQFDIFGSLTDVISLVQSSYSSKNITIHLEGKSIFFYGLKNELKQVFINILNNAKDAIITLQNQNQIKEGFIFIKIKKENNHVVITIKDNGGGIEKSNMEKIFDPYFTTKFKSQGTGIGLYMSYQIISEHMHGELTVKNENFKCNHQSYKGAVFSIILPSNNTREEDES